MDVLLVNLEIAALSTMLVALYALRERFGLAPLYMAVGLLLAFMMLGSRLEIDVPVPGGRSMSYTSLEHLTLVLTSVVMLYTLEGTSEARRMIAGIACTNIGVFLLRLLISFHLKSSGADLSILGREKWIDPTVTGALFSTLSLVASGVAIIVVYQGLHNLWKKVPNLLSLALALLVAMIVDSMLYGTLSGDLDLSRTMTHVSGKVTGALAAIIPVGLFVAWQLRHAGEDLKRGVRERRTFDIMSLRKQVKTAQEELERSRAEVTKVRDLFSRYVEKDVVDEILENTSTLKLGGERRHVTVLFSDIRGYSTLSEHLSPEETITLLNRYFSAMGEIIHFERGTIIEFEGDAILAVFGAPLDQDDHASRAVRAGLNMLRQVMRLNRRWDADGTSEKWKSVGIESFKIRLGIHSGPVVVGNIGSETRTKYAVIGDTVNTAHRVESLNKTLHTTLLLSSATLAEMKRTGDDALPFVDLGEHKVRGREEKVHVFSLHDLLDEHEKELDE